MINYISIKNFLSIGEEQVLHFDYEYEDYHIKRPSNPFIGVFGANQSGKTNVLKAIHFAFWFLQNSGKYYDIMPLKPFITKKDEPTKIELIFTASNGDEWQYLLEISNNLPNPIIREELYLNTLNSTPLHLMVERVGEKVYIDPLIQIPTNFKISDLNASASILSYLKSLGIGGILESFMSYKFFSPLNLFSKKSKQRPFDYLDGMFVKIFADGVSKKFLEFVKYYDDSICDMKCTTIDNGTAIPYLDGIDIKRIIDGQEVKSMLFSESENLINYIETLALIFNSLSLGCALLLDGNFANLHYKLTEALIMLYKSYENENNAQLIFTSNATEILEYFHPEEFFMTEKGDNGQTSCFSMADFEDIERLRKSDIDKLYRIGKLGAHPKIYHI